MDTQSSHLFVYGSLRLGFHDPAYSYLSRYFHFIGEGSVQGKFYFNGSYPVAVETTEDKFITGDLYAFNDLDEFNWVMIQLDDYEGLNVDPGEKTLYKRALVKVFINEIPTTAWIYWFNGSIDNMPEMNPGEIAKYLQQHKKI